MIGFLAGIMMAMAVWGVVMHYAGDKLGEDKEKDKRIVTVFLSGYVLVEAFVVGVVFGGLFL